MANRIPAMMHSAYARIGSGPRCQTLCVGLGIEASVCTRPRYLATLRS
jgi:hypothetical protein